MKPNSLILSGLLLAMLVPAAYSQSLADLAKKEAERRKAIQEKAKVITDQEADKYRSAPVTTTMPATTASGEKPESVGEPPTGSSGAAGEEGTAATQPKPATDEPVDFQGRTESFWKTTFADARKKVSDLENEANALVLKLNDLQNKFYRESDGFKQQEWQRQIQKTIYEIDQNKENLEKAKTELADLELEARKSGALPGWIRETKK
jgi:hypothetical protein